MQGIDDTKEFEQAESQCSNEFLYNKKQICNSISNINSNKMYFKFYGQEGIEIQYGYKKRAILFFSKPEDYN